MYLYPVPIECRDRVQRRKHDQELTFLSGFASAVLGIDFSLPNLPELHALMLDEGPVDAPTEDADGADPQALQSTDQGTIPEPPLATANQVHLPSGDGDQNGTADHATDPRKGLTGATHYSER